MSKVTDFIQGIKEAREARADEKAVAKYKEETLKDGLKFWSERAKEYGDAHDKAIAEGKTNIGYNEFDTDGNRIGEVYKDQNGAVYQSCIWRKSNNKSGHNRCKSGKAYFLSKRFKAFD